MPDTPTRLCDMAAVLPHAGHEFNSGNLRITYWCPGITAPEPATPEPAFAGLTAEQGDRIADALERIAEALEHTTARTGTGLTYGGKMGRCVRCHIAPVLLRYDLCGDCMAIDRRAAAEHADKGARDHQPTRGTEEA